ncbi:HNH endonuclease signature motif containing protein [Arthrobacter sp. PAMC 25486]|uniref:HNH endonuclease signature motif containing protein n=1 Tax=Arthrobacter sp. PAMC 25486 TaxID=1494608 RepID=UPI0012FEEE78|nr:HNH endonuclease signature motif containing protein [Arthrobacter sp. PAMC 25486]
MSSRAFVPGDRDEEAAAQGVAALIAGITLPSIERFGSDNVALSGLPDCVLFPFPDPEPPSRASVARWVIADGMASLDEIRVLENAVAASKAAVVDRILGALAVESEATGLSRYQTGMAETGCVAEIAAALGIPERTAAALSAHAVNLQEHPKTWAALGLGVLSWRHALTILNELGTLGETPQVSVEDAAVFEGRLLLLAEGTTALRFANKARQARESLFPDSLDARVKEAFRGRKITNDPGRDGMNWVELHIPTIAANAIMVHCTRAARAVKADALERQREAVASGSGEDCTEYRTLDQLRADIASILLMGQELPANARHTTQNQNTNPDRDRNGSPGRNGSRGHNETGDESSDGAGYRTGFGGTASTGGSAGFTDSPNHGGRDGNPRPEGHEGSASVGDGVVISGFGRGSNEANQGVGYVPFGEKSAFGVTLEDEEPPWAHGLPDPVHSEVQLPELTGPTPKSQRSSDTGQSARAQLSIGDAGVGGGGESDGEALRETLETSGYPDADPDADSDAHADAVADEGPLEGTVVSTGSGDDDSGGPAASHTGARAAGHPAESSAEHGGGASGSHGAGPADGSAGHDDVPVEGFLVGDGSGYVDGRVDGIAEQPLRESQEQEAYLEQLTRLGGYPVLLDPPMPKALVLVKVSFLGLLGITDEPAELDDSTAGPVPLEIARKLLSGSNTFLRVLTDPITGEALPLEPQRYTLKDSERSVLQALAGGCYFPNCTNPVMDTELDHVQSFDSGGKSTMENLFPACRKHHALKHFKDDKDRKGNLRRWAEPWRTGLRLHGWTPRLCGDGRVGWVSPSGTYRAPECIKLQRPAYPKWLKKRLDKALTTPEGSQPMDMPAASTQPENSRPGGRSPDHADLASPLERSIFKYLRTHAK